MRKFYYHSSHPSYAQWFHPGDPTTSCLPPEHTDFLMMKENGKWYFATKEGGLFLDTLISSSRRNCVYDEAVSNRQYKEREWPANWAELPETSAAQPV